MSTSFMVQATARTDTGKGASRRLRRIKRQVPGIVYGANKDPELITMELKALVKLLEQESFYSNILTLEIENTAQKVVLKDLQRDPAKDLPIHIDFLRIDEHHKIRMHVPIHFINEDQCIGVKTKGGLITHLMTEVEVICLPQHLPEYIEADMLNIEVGQAVHLSDLALPEGVQLGALLQGKDHDLTVANVQQAKGGSDEDEIASSPDEPVKDQ